VCSHTACDRCRARCVRQEIARKALEFERRVLVSLDASKNSQKVTGTCGTQMGRAIPDGIRQTDLIEVKSGSRVCLTRQLRILVSSATSTGMRLYLVVSPQTCTISYPLAQAIDRTGGQVLIFDPRTSRFRSWWDRVTRHGTRTKAITPG
jgi:hypothetical protein